MFTKWITGGVVVAQIQRSPKSRFGISQIDTPISDIPNPHFDLGDRCSPNRILSQIAIWVNTLNRNLGHPKSKLGISQIAIWYIPNRNLGYPKSRFGALSQIATWDISNRNLVHYPKSQLGISQIAIWCIIPNRNLGYPKSWFGASQIETWDIPNRNLVHYPKS